MRCLQVLLTVGAVGLGGACANDHTCPSGAPNLVRLCLGAPNYVAYRDGTAAWQTTVPHEAGMYDLCVSKDYEVVAVTAESDGSLFAYESASTFNETSSDTSCNDWYATTTRVAVTGLMAGSGTVQMDSYGKSASMPFQFEIDVAPGLHDLVATDYATPNAGGNVLIRRRQVIDADTTEPPVDLVADGTPLMYVPLTVTGLAANETISTTVMLISNPSDAAQISATNAASAAVVPPSLLESNDEQVLQVYGRSRGVDVTFTGSETSFDLLPPLTGVVFANAPEVTATWTQLPVPTYSRLQLNVMGTGRGTSSRLEEFVYASKGWLDAHDPMSLSFDTSAPGYQAGWTIDPMKPQQNNFSLSVGSGNASYWTGTGYLSGAAPRQVPGRRGYAAPRPQNRTGR